MYLKRDLKPEHRLSLAGIAGKLSFRPPVNPVRNPHPHQPLHPLSPSHRPSLPADHRYLLLCK